MCTINGMTFPAPPSVLDVVLGGCTIYKLLLVLTQRDVLYQNYTDLYFCLLRMDVKLGLSRLGRKYAEGILKIES